MSRPRKSRSPSIIMTARYCNAGLFVNFALRFRCPVASSSVIGTTIKTTIMTPKTSFSPRFLVMTVLLCTCLVASNIFAPRTVQFGKLPLLVSCADIIFPVSYILNDCLTEVYGYRKTRLVIWIGFAMNLFVAVAAGIVCLFPVPPDAESAQIASSFNNIFGLVPRSVAASLLAFLCGSTVNSWIMSRMKVSTKGKGFGWRAVLSSIGGELVDSLIFCPIVFIGVLPFVSILWMILTEVTVKTLYEVLILPVTARVVKYVKSKEGLDTYDDNISYNPFKLKDF